MTLRFIRSVLGLKQDESLRLQRYPGLRVKLLESKEITEKQAKHLAALLAHLPTL